PHSFDLVEGGGHSWGSGSMPERLAASLTFVAKGLAAGDAPADGARGTNGTNGTGGADGEDAEDEGSPPEGSGDGEERPRDPARDAARRSLCRRRGAPKGKATDPHGPPHRRTLPGVERGGRGGWPGNRVLDEPREVRQRGRSREPKRRRRRARSRL